MAGHVVFFAVGCDVNHIRLFPLGLNLRSPGYAENRIYLADWRENATIKSWKSITGSGFIGSRLEKQGRFTVESVEPLNPEP
jgi:hypothetical protein